MNSEEIENLLKALRRNRITGRYYDTANDLIDTLSDYLKPGLVVGVGDSQTLEELGIYELLRSSEVEFLDKYKPSYSKSEKKALYRRNFTSDLFLSGLNAITLEGKIFNLDGNGSRVAPIIYGPTKVILICGTNKIVMDDDGAIERIRDIAAPIDAKRLGKKTPCVKTGRCMDCKSSERICNYHTIIQGQFDASRIEVMILDGDYGY